MHFSGPDRSVFYQGREFAQDVRVAQDMAAPQEVEVAFPAIMDGTVLELFYQGRGGQQGICAPLGVDE